METIVEWKRDGGGVDCCAGDGETGNETKKLQKKVRDKIRL